MTVPVGVRGNVWLGIRITSWKVQRLQRGFFKAK